MLINITGIDLFDQNACMTCAKVRLRHMDITGIDLFDSNMDMACAEARLRCAWISLILIYLIKMVV